MNKKLAKRGGIGLGVVLTAAALVIAPALTASAAIVPTVGSVNPVYLLDGSSGAQLAAGTVLGWNTSVLSSPDGTVTTPFTAPAGAVSAKTFISQRGKETSLSTWSAYGPLSLTALATPNLKPSGNTTAGLGTPSGSTAVANAGGDYSLGVAFLDSTNHVLEADYTYITVVGNANAALATYTFAVPAAWTPDFTTFSATAGASAVIRNGNLQISATAANANKTVDVWVEGATSKAVTVTLDASGNAVNTLPAGISAGTRLALAEGHTIDAWIAASVPAPIQQPTSPANDATKVTITDPAPGVKTIVVPAGAANANKVLNVTAWSAGTSLGQVTTDASGNATVDASALPAGSHTVALTDPNTDAYVAWGTFTLSSTTQFSTTLSADVTNSGKFALEGGAAAVNLTPVSAITRGATTAPVALGQFKVTDDRNVLLGWTLKADVANFTSGANTIPNSAFGIAPSIVDGVSDGITLGAAQVAGSASYPVAKIAEAAPGSSTLAVGTDLNANLTFKAPNNALSGTYTSTLTLTLTSK
ncbi:hypothetical protein ABCS02_08565 [Microbacterium sp. X-17]|uniref:hypothetical protein n=1 Tax=Microbacterium sp. X-17 TaxID=3144404 RepID=UPI0031F5CF7E